MGIQNSYHKPAGRNVTRSIRQCIDHFCFAHHKEVGESRILWEDRKGLIQFYGTIFKDNLQLYRTTRAIIKQNQVQVGVFSTANVEVIFQRHIHLIVSLAGTE